MSKRFIRLVRNLLTIQPDMYYIGFNKKGKPMGNLFNFYYFYFYFDKGHP